MVSSVAVRLVVVLVMVGGWVGGYVYGDGGIAMETRYALRPLRGSSAIACDIGCTWLLRNIC